MTPVAVSHSHRPSCTAAAVRRSRSSLCRSASSRDLSAYIYAATGPGESSTDLSWDGQTMIYENGTLLAESERFPQGPRRSVADLDVATLASERLRQGTFDDNRRAHAERTGAFRTVEFALGRPRGDLGLRRPVARYPFVPADAERLAKSDWPAVEKDTQSDPAKRNYVHTFLTKRAGTERGATADALKRAWDSIPTATRRGQISEEALLAITKATLESFRYTVLTAASGPEAVACFAEKRDDIKLVLTDMAMPLMDGVATGLAIRKISPNVPIIIISGLDPQKDEDTTRRLRAAAFLPKPFTAEVLLQLIHDVLTKNPADG